MISIVIPAYNEEKSLSLCLSAIMATTYSHDYEVIVVDNASTDNTRQVAESFEGKLPIRVVHEKIKGRGAARRAGFGAARGEIICSTDADAKVPSNWIEKLTAVLVHSDAVAATGTGRIVDCSSYTNLMFNTGQPLFMHVYRLLFGHYWLTGFNFAIRTDIYKKSGGFNPRLNIQEDIDLSMRVSTLGRIAYFSDMPVLVSGRRFRDGLVSGAWPYIQTFLEYYISKRDTVVLGDIR